MEQNYFLFDKVLPFIKTKKKLEFLNLYQVYIQRYGIGKQISLKISKYSGVHLNYKMINYKENDLNVHTKLVFILAEDSLDSLLEKKNKISLQKSIDLYDYRGSLYKECLPINGQRRRANKKTAKRVRPIIIKKN